MSDRQEIEDALNEKDARIAELERELAVRKAAIEAQFRLMERVRELEKALRDVVRNSATIRGDICGGDMHPFAAQYLVSARAVDAARTLVGL